MMAEVNLLHFYARVEVSLASREERRELVLEDLSMKRVELEVGWAMMP